VFGFGTIQERLSQNSVNTSLNTNDYSILFLLPSFLKPYLFMDMKDFIIVKTREELGPEENHLISKAEESLVYAYAPYSKFRVGVALLMDNGVIVTGTNQENAAYPSGMCAERVALFTIASQYPGVRIKKLAVVAKRENDHRLTPATCCGSCRQVMLEFEERQNSRFEVIMQHDDGSWIKAVSAKSLLPFSFTNSSLW
jgi:cytidine deaminase